MFQTLRQSMTWMHTWFGLVLGFVLMIAFFFGSLSVFDREIDRWTVPATRFEAQHLPSFDAVLVPIFERVAPDADELAKARRRVDGTLPAQLPVREWGAYTTHRDPVLDVYVGYGLPGAHDPEDRVYGTATLDPRTGSVLSKGQLKVGSAFFYPMHYGLHLTWVDLGIWIVGLAALAMLVALVSGAVIHRKIFREFFTFRPRGHPRRAMLDLHDLTGVLALPFLFLITLSGMIIFAELYFPVLETTMKPLHEAHDRQESAETGLALEPAGRPGHLASVDAMIARAEAHWAERGIRGDAGGVYVTHVGDANAYVSIYRATTDRVATSEGLHFEASTGRILYEDPPAATVSAVRGFFTGLHLQQFEHWLLRWLFFVGGLAGCACIATGFLFFVDKRKRQHAQHGISGARWVDALAVATVCGAIVATLSMLVVNRLLPEALESAAEWQRGAFWCSWLVSLAHAVVRTAPVAQGRFAPAWAEQCVAIAALGISAVLLNWITTGDHLIQTLSTGYWPVAGVDLMLLATAITAAWTAIHLRRATRESCEEESSLATALPEVPRA